MHSQAMCDLQANNISKHQKQCFHFYITLQYFLDAIFSEARMGLRSGLLTKQFSFYLMPKIVYAIAFLIFCYQCCATRNKS